MKYPIEGKVFCVSGSRMRRRSRPATKRLIEDAGGVIAKNVTKKTDYLVTGQYPASAKVGRAYELGLPVIDEYDLEAFLNGEEIEFDEGVVIERGEEPMRDLIGEARATLDGTPDSAMWTKIVELVDACAPEQLPSFIDYLEPQLALWQPHQDDYWEAVHSTHGVDLAPEFWIRDIPHGELRVAPHQWLVDAIEGTLTSRLRLVRAIHLTNMRLNGTKAAKLVTCEDLVNLRFLDIGDNRLSKTFFKKLCTAPSAPVLERLRVTYVNEKNVSGLLGEHQFERLREFIINRPSCIYDSASVRQVLNADWMQRVEVFGVANTFGGEAEYYGLDTTDALTNVHTMLWSSGGDGQDINKELKTPAAKHAPTVAAEFVIHASHDASIEELTRRCLAQLNQLTARIEDIRHLDISRVRVLTTRYHYTRIMNHRNDTGLEFPEGHEQAAMARALTEWKIPSCLETITLGQWWSESTARALSDAHGLRVLA